MFDKKLFSQEMDLDLNIVESAVENLQQKNNRFIAVSGKIGSGKDTVAPLVISSLGINPDDSIQEFFARPLKSEIDQVIKIVRSHLNIEKAVFVVSKEMKVPYAKSLKTVAFIHEEVSKDHSLTAYSRTSGIRRALQYWGTEVRREQDPDYWVKRAMKSVYHELALGKSVYITDARFPNELIAASNALGKTIRLDVSYEEQSRRIKNRDGISVSEEAKNHPSETSLDDYENFDVRVMTDHLNPSEVAEEIVAKIY